MEIIIESCLQYFFSNISVFGMNEGYPNPLTFLYSVGLLKLAGLFPKSFLVTEHRPKSHSFPSQDV